MTLRHFLTLKDLSEQELKKILSRAAQLKEYLKDCQNITEIRGQGLMIGIEFNAPCKDLVDLAAEQGLLINVTAGSVIRLLPPLNITSEQVEILIDILTKVIKKG